MRFDLLERSEVIQRLSEASSIAGLKKAFRFRFKNLDLAKLNQGILKMAQADCREVPDYQVVRDMVNHNWLSEGLTRDGF